MMSLRNSLRISFRLVINSVRLLLYILTTLVPRREDIWAFGSESKSTEFADNGKYLYLHCHHNTDLTPVWISQNEHLVSELTDRGYNAFTPTSPRGIYYVLRSQVVILTQDLFQNDIPWQLVGGACRIQLWHGIPLKTIGSFKWNPNSAYQYIAYWVDQWDMYITTSKKLATDLFIKAGASQEKLRVTGYPRNAVLQRSIPDEDIFIDQSVKNTIQEVHADTVFVYMPTWRKDGAVPVNHALQLTVLDTVLGDTGGHLFIKTHPRTDWEDTTSLENITVLPNDIDIYPVLREIDVLITDYSSVYFDYLLTDGQLIFYPYDLDEYKTSRGLLAEYETVTPGPIAMNFDELVESIRKATNSDCYADERAKLRSEVHDHTDGEYSERVIDEIRSL